MGGGFLRGELNLLGSFFEGGEDDEYSPRTEYYYYDESRYAGSWFLVDFCGLVPWEVFWIQPIIEMQVSNYEERKFGGLFY